MKMRDLETSETMADEERTSGEKEMVHRQPLPAMAHQQTNEPSHEEADPESLILIVIPIYNEVQWLPSLVHQLLQQRPPDIPLMEQGRWLNNWRFCFLTGWISCINPRDSGWTLPIEPLWGMPSKEVTPS